MPGRPLPRAPHVKSEKNICFFKKYFLPLPIVWYGVLCSYVGDIQLVDMQFCQHCDVEKRRRRERGEKWKSGRVEEW